MSMKKIVLAAAMSTAMSMGVAHAADQGSGTINFTGSIIDAPCSIEGENATQDVDLGKVSSAALNKGGTSTPVPFKIELKNCDTSKNSVTTTFTGAESSTTTGLLGIAGNAKGASIAITDGSGTLIKLGSASAAQAMMAGDNTLAFSAYLQGDSGSATIVPGDFTSVAQFTLAYQ